jgi:hypothetical protein
VTLSDHCCEFERTVGRVGIGETLNRCETELTCVSPGSHCGGSEYEQEEMGMFNLEVLRDGAGAIERISLSDNFGGSDLELETSTVKSMHALAGDLSRLEYSGTDGGMCGVFTPRGEDVDETSDIMTLSICFCGIDWG